MDYSEMLLFIVLKLAILDRNQDEQNKKCNCLLTFWTCQHGITTTILLAESISHFYYTRVLIGHVTSAGAIAEVEERHLFCLYFVCNRNGGCLRWKIPETHLSCQQTQQKNQMQTVVFTYIDNGFGMKKATAYYYRYAHIVYSSSSVDLSTEMLIKYRFTVSFVDRI